jgi:hypothetical protein
LTAYLPASKVLYQYPKKRDFLEDVDGEGRIIDHITVDFK